MIELHRSLCACAFLLCHCSKHKRRLVIVSGVLVVLVWAGLSAVWWTFYYYGKAYAFQTGRQKLQTGLRACGVWSVCAKIEKRRRQTRHIRTMFKEIVLQEAQRRVQIARRLKELAGGKWFSSELSELLDALDEEERAATDHLRDVRSTMSLTLLDVSSEVMAKVCTYFDEYDLVNLGLTCKHFGMAQAGQAISAISLVEESARQIFNHAATDGDRASLPRYDGESNIAYLRQLYLMRRPLLFDRTFGEGTITRNAVVSTGKPSVSAIGSHVMRAGKHFTLFSIDCGNTYGPELSVHVGVMRPIQFDTVYEYTFSPLFLGSEDYNPRDQRTACWGRSEIHCCSFWFGSGECWSTDWTVYEPESCGWEGLSAWDDTKAEVGLLLDLDRGTLSAYDGSLKLGVMKEGLEGEYSWFTEIEEHNCTVSIERCPLPSG